MNDYLPKRLTKHQSERINLSNIEICLLTDNHDIEIFDATITKYHYLKNCTLVGEQLRYVAVADGRWVALSCWSSAALHLKDREEWLGWNEQQRKNRIHAIANNSRYLLLSAGGYCPNLGSFVMSKVLKRLSDDWNKKYGHPIVCVESFVDPDYFQGTLYKACNWELLGKTRGCKRSRMDYYEKHNKPKQLWVKKLTPDADKILRSLKLPEKFSSLDKASYAHYCHEGEETLKSLHDFVATIPDWRTRRRNYRKSSLVSLLIVAALSGVSSGQRDLAGFTRCLSEKQLQALGFTQMDKNGKLLRPGESTFQRALAGIDTDALQTTLLAYQDHLLGKQKGTQGVVGFDGKALRGGKSGLQTLNFFDSRDGGRWIGSEQIEDKTNEIPVSQKKLKDPSLDLTGRLIMADALNTQHLTAQCIVQDSGGDYLFVVKDNHSKLRQRIASKFEDPEIPELSPLSREA